MWLDQVRTVVNWLTEKKPASLILFYLTQPADKIRAFGPNSPEADLAVYKVRMTSVYKVRMTSL